MDVVRRTQQDGYDLLFRVATVEDYDQVMAIDENVYEGHDYLPAFYHCYLSQPNNIAALCEANGKVVSFSMITIADDGYTAIGRAGRTHKHYQRLRISSQLATFLDDTVRRMVPKVCRKVFVSDSDNPYFHNVKSHIPIIAERKYYTMIPVNLSDMRTKLSPEMQARQENDDKIFLLSAQDTQRVLAQPEMFANRRVIINWVPYETTETNARLIARSENPACFSDGHSTASFLTGYSTFDKDTIVCNLDIYHKNVRQILSHLYLQLDKVANDFGSKFQSLRFTFLCDFLNAAQQNMMLSNLWENLGLWTPSTASDSMKTPGFCQVYERPWRENNKL